MSKKEYLTTQIKALGDDKMFLNAAYGKVTEDMASISMIKDFFKRWKNAGSNEAGYKIAIQGLPKDNPNTTVNEAVSEEKFKDKLEKFFNEKMSDVTKEIYKAKDVNAVYKKFDDIAQKGRIATLKKQLLLNMMRDDKEREIKNLQAIQKEDYSVD